MTTEQIVEATQNGTILYAVGNDLKIFKCRIKSITYKKGNVMMWK